MRPYAIAAMAVLCATLVRLALDPLVSLKDPFLFFAVAVVFAALYGGAAAGISATVVSLPICDYFFVDPVYTWFLEDAPGDSIMLGLFAGLGIALSLIIDKWRRTQESLQESISAQQNELKLRTLTASVPGGLFTATPEGECDYLSESLREYAGIHHEPLASSWKKAVHPDDLDRFVDVWSQSLRASSEFNTICRVRRSDGEYRWFQCLAKPVRDSHAKVVKWAGICTDIHDRKMHEQALTQRSEELLQSSADFQRFAYLVSHDLQEPLRMIGIYTELLVGHEGEKAGAETPLFTRYILEGVERIRRQLAQLIEYARSGYKQPERKLIDLNVVLKLVLTNLHPPIAETAAIVTCDPMPSIVTDHDQIASVFQNLIGNALKYRGSEPPRIHVSVDDLGDGWKFAVQDNGIGFDMKDAERIFGTFERLNGTSKVQGAGLGLAIVKRIIEARGGRIWAESQPGKGSTFYFKIPAKVPAPKEALSSPQIPERDSYSEQPVPPRLQ